MLQTHVLCPVAPYCKFRNNFDLLETQVAPLGHPLGKALPHPVGVVLLFSPQARVTPPLFDGTQEVVEGSLHMQMSLGVVLSGLMFLQVDLAGHPVTEPTVWHCTIQFGMFWANEKERSPKRRRFLSMVGRGELQIFMVR